jgi:recombination protein RecR
MSAARRPHALRQGLAVGAGGAGGGGSGAYPAPVAALIDELARLPGVGRRSAERLTFFLLKSDLRDAQRLSQAILDVKQKVRHCAVCFNLTDEDPCRICAAVDRDLEETALYKGVYHVLMGRLDPLGGVEPSDLTLAKLFRRIDTPAENARAVPVGEVILGLNPDLEGDTTALYLAEQLRRRGVVVSRLARGLPSGSQLEYASRAVLADAIEGRQQVR